MTESFTKLIIDNKLHIQESQNNQKLETKYKNLYLCILQSNCRRSKTKIKLWKKPKGRWKHLSYTRERIRIILEFSETILVGWVEWHVKVLNKKLTSAEFCIQQNCPSNVMAQCSLSETNKSWGSLLQVDLPYKKC